MNEIGASCRIHESIRFHFMIEHDCQMTKSQITKWIVKVLLKVATYNAKHDMEVYVNAVLIFGLSSFMITTDHKNRLSNQMISLFRQTSLPPCIDFSIFIPSN